MVDPVEAFLNKLHHPMLASIDLSLDRMHRLLGLLGNPQKRLPPVLHVAGTNGKGSLLADLKAILEAGGYRVHRYTSPHLAHFRERIVLAGREIENAYLANIVKHLASVLPSQPATFFEATTAIAFLAFAEHKADILLLETGMGGRLDATNVIEKPLLTAITPISFDHGEYLGTTLTAIAGEKAGIVKRGVPCVVGRQEAEARAVIEAKAAALAAPLYRLREEWNWRRENGNAIYQSQKRTVEFKPSLAGEYQYDNAATAIACLDQMPQFALSDAHIREGLAHVQWPARLQRLTGHHASFLPSGMELWLDGGHNPQGGQVLADWLKPQNKDVYLVCGMLKGKDMSAYLKPLAAQARSLYAVAIPDEANSQSASAVESAARALGIEAVAAPSVENALQTIARHAKTPSIICICGSLYLAGKVLARE
jgi:dihydrofolate synthase / folylpolyglutamate synthase